MADLLLNPAKLAAAILVLLGLFLCVFIGLFMLIAMMTIPQMPFGQDLAWQWVFGTLKANPCTPIALPVAGEITAGFDDPDYLDTFGRRHTGIDIAVPEGTKAVATIEGKVTFAGWNDEGYGNLVIVENGNYTTYFAHLSEIDVEVGQTVSKGQVIALTGDTGDTTGPHIHYEVRYNGEPMDLMVGNGNEVFIGDGVDCEPKLPPPPFQYPGKTLTIAGEGVYQATHAELLPEDAAPGWHGRVFGFVRGADGLGRGGVEVEVAWDGGHMLTRTAPNGWYEFILGPGQYRVRVVD
ncbi:MAG: M23 family metallopeptidase, partial [Caldilineae bacterium]